MLPVTQMSYLGGSLRTSDLLQMLSREKHLDQQLLGAAAARKGERTFRYTSAQQRYTGLTLLTGLCPTLR